MHFSLNCAPFPSNLLKVSHTSSGKGPVVFQNRSVESWEHVNQLDIEKVKLEVGFQKTHFSVRTSLWPMKPCVCRKGSPTWYPDYSGRRMDQKKHGIRLELLFFDQRKENSVSRQPHHYMRLYFPGWFGWCVRSFSPRSFCSHIRGQVDEVTIGSKTSSLLAFTSAEPFFEESPPQFVSLCRTSTATPASRDLRPSPLLAQTAVRI